MSITKYGVSPEGIDKTAQGDEEAPKACPHCGKPNGPHACVVEHSPLAKKALQEKP